MLLGVVVPPQKPPPVRLTIWLPLGVAEPAGMYPETWNWPGTMSKGVPVKSMLLRPALGKVGHAVARARQRAGIEVVATEAIQPWLVEKVVSLSVSVSVPGLRRALVYQVVCPMEDVFCPLP